MPRSSRRVRLETALNSVDSPVFLIDDRRRVAFLNRGCEQLTGWTLADIGNSVCEFPVSALAVWLPVVFVLFVVAGLELPVCEDGRLGRRRPGGRKLPSLDRAA